VDSCVTVPSNLRNTAVEPSVRSTVGGLAEVTLMTSIRNHATPMRLGGGILELLSDCSPEVLQVADHLALQPVKHQAP